MPGMHWSWSDYTSGTNVQPVCGLYSKPTRVREREKRKVRSYSIIDKADIGNSNANKFSMVAYLYLCIHVFNSFCCGTIINYYSFLTITCNSPKRYIVLILFSHSDEMYLERNTMWKRHTMLCYTGFMPHAIRLILNHYHIVFIHLVWDFIFSSSFTCEREGAFDTDAQNDQ